MSKVIPLPSPIVAEDLEGIDFNPETMKFPVAPKELLWAPRRIENIHMAHYNRYPEYPVMWKTGLGDGRKGSQVDTTLPLAINLSGDSYVSDEVMAGGVAEIYNTPEKGNPGSAATLRGTWLELGPIPRGNRGA